MSDWLEPLREALDVASRPVSSFFRDDDAGWRDDRLLALLDLFAERGLPLDLAVIPAFLRPLLARELVRRAEAPGHRLHLHQHGRAHCNHEPEGRSCEFGPARDRVAQLHDLERGRRRLERYLGGRVDPIFTPPWNRCTATTGECLLELGIPVLSREWRAEPLGVPGLIELPISVDWLARHKGRPLTRVELGLALAAAATSTRPLGVMFHHAVMDDAELDAAAELLDLLAAHPQSRPQPMVALALACKPVEAPA
ncbi:MAG TPA: hypothetical protein VGF23_03850 [Gaiellaceae bacterium]